MKLRTKFLLFIAVVHSLVIGLSFYIFKDDKLIFIASEAFILLSLFISWQLYKELIAPLQLLMTGVDAIRDKDFNVKFLKTGKLEMDNLIEVYNLMIDQIRQERTQQEQQHYFLEKLINTSPTGIIILDFDENIANLNPKALEMLGFEEKNLLGKSIAELKKPIFQAINLLKTGESKTISPNGNQTYKIQKSHFIDRGFAHQFVMIEELTAEILAAEKKAYGKVIRMMAHEVNNSIGAVNSILDTTAQSINHEPDIANALQIAINRNDHLNLFMRNFADVVRLPELRLETIDLNELLRNAIKLMQFKAETHNIVFEVELTETPIWISADIHQMEQVLINIIKNSIESILLQVSAVRRSDNQRIIKTKTTNFPKQLSIEDNGIGISAEIEEHLFSPFFSTKKDGQGIGLMLIREVLMNHNFTFSLKTNADMKTVFWIGF